MIQLEFINTRITQCNDDHNSCLRLESFCINQQYSQQKHAVIIEQNIELNKTFTQIATCVFYVFLVFYVFHVFNI
jgi:hypothetical protein